MKKESKKSFVIMAIIAVCTLIMLAYFLFEDNNLEPKHKYQWWIEDINWSYRQSKLPAGTPPVKIAVIDTGIDSTHPDLLNTVIDEFYVSSLAKEGPIDFEHGTSVVGIIAGNPASQDGIQGIAPSSLIYSFDVSNGTKDIRVCDLVKAIEKATELNVDIINISMGTTKDDPELHEAVQKAYQSGIVVVAAIGNDASRNMLYPAMYDEVLAVGSLNKQHDELYGQPFLEGILYLPGENILTTYSSPMSEKKTISQSGTSLSTPILTGIIALVMQRDELVSVDEIYEYFLAIESYEWDVSEILSDF